MTDQTRASLEDVGNLAFDALCLMDGCQIGLDGDSLEVLNVTRCSVGEFVATLEIVLENGQQFSIVIGALPDVIMT